MVIIALICPSPGVSISSASAAAGSSDSTSGWPETRLCQRPVRNPRPGRGRRGAGADRRQREHRPAGPVQVAGQDVDDVDQPAAEGAELDGGGADPAVHRGRRGARRAPGPASGSPRRRRRSARRRASGAKSAASARTSSTPSTCVGQPRPRSTRPSSNSTCTTANSSAASVPGRGAMCRSASSAVRVRAGSMTTSRPPRLRSALSLPPKSAAVARLPLDTSGLAPMIDEVVGAVEVGHRERDRVAEHQAQRHVFGHLVEGARGEHLAGAEAADDQRRVQRAGDGVRVRIAEVHADRRAAVLGARTAPRPSATAGERLVPGGLDQLPVAADQRRASAGRGRRRVRRSSRPWGR